MRLIRFFALAIEIKIKKHLQICKMYHIIICKIYHILIWQIRHNTIELNLLMGVSILSELQNFLDIALKDPKIKESRESTPEQDIRKAMMSARTELGITQKQLAELTGIQQANISRLENGNYNPSLNILKRVAKGLGKKVRIEFE